MRRESPAGSDRGAGASPRRSILESLASSRVAVLLTLMVVVLVSFATQGLCASTASNPIPGGLTVRRSMRAAPHRLIVFPSAPVVAANQTQRFTVTDAQGNPVTVHWNVSGIGCSGQACGTIDEQGLYQPPVSLPQPHIVTIEGVLASDPNYSVLTEVRLAEVATPAAKPMSSVASARKPQPLAAPEIGRQTVARKAEVPALPQAVSAAPVIGKQSVARSGKLPSLPNAVTSAPILESRTVARKGELLPLPRPVPSTPTVERTLSSRAGAPPLQGVITAPPQVESPGSARSGERLPLPAAVPATPAVERTSERFSSRGTLPQPIVIAAAPQIETGSVARNREVPPLPSAVAATPAVEKTNVASRGAMPPLPNAVTAAPEVQKQTLNRGGQLPPVANAVLVASKVEKQDIPRSAVLMPSAVAAPSSKENSSKEKRKEVHSIELPLAGGISSSAALGGTTVHRAPVSQQPVVIASAVPPPAAHISNQNFAANQTQFAPVVAKQSPPASAVLAPSKAIYSPLPEANAANLGLQPASAQHAVHSPVTYTDGQLTIDSENLTLAAVLQLVAEKTGAVIEVPPGTGTERIIEHAGPGRPEDVLASLLNGSPFDFVIVGSPLRPDVTTQVLLSLHKAEDTNTIQALPRQAIASAALFTPPPDPAATTAQPYIGDIIKFEPPKEPMTPEDMGKLMREKAQQLRERLQQQQQ